MDALDQTVLPQVQRFLKGVERVSLSKEEARAAKKAAEDAAAKKAAEDAAAKKAAAKKAAEDDAAFVPPKEIHKVLASNSSSTTQHLKADTEDTTIATVRWDRIDKPENTIVLQ